MLVLHFSRLSPLFSLCVCARACLIKHLSPLVINKFVSLEVARKKYRGNAVTSALTGVITSDWATTLRAHHQVSIGPTFQRTNNQHGPIPSSRSFFSFLYLKKNICWFGNISKIGACRPPTGRQGPICKKNNYLWTPEGVWPIPSTRSY